MRRSQFEQAMDILRYVALHPGKSKSYVMVRVNLVYATLNVIIETFVEKGLLEIDRGKMNAQKLFITDRGKIALSQYRTLLQWVGLTWEERKYADMPETRRRHAKSLSGSKVHR